MHFSVEHLPVDELRRLELESTQALLGDTIQISDADWESPSQLTGWTRSHVAAHLARNADAYRQAVKGALAGELVQMYPDDVARLWDVERSSEQTPLELQIDLDTSASELSSAFEKVNEQQWNVPVRFAECVFPLKLIVLSRLSEVVLHHIDLDCGFRTSDLDEDVAQWVLNWCVYRLQQAPPPTGFQVQLPDGPTVTIGQPEADQPVVTGTVTELVGWLSGRTHDDDVSAFAGIVPKII